MGGIGHAHQQLRGWLTRAAACHDVAGHGFIQALRVQAVSAWQIQYAHLPTAGCGELAFFALNRYAGVVGYFLARARQDVEQRGFAAIGVA